jgi:hypothetical protein
MIKNYRMRRKIPVFRVSLNGNTSYAQLKEIPEIKRAVLEETLYAIKDGIEKKKNSISLFEIADTNCFVDLKKENWESTLNVAMEYFSELEDYNRCIEVRDLKKRL